MSEASAIPDGPPFDFDPIAKGRLMKFLDGRELAGYVKERQAKETRRLKAAKVQPTLAIVSEGENSVNALYLKIKQKYGKDIGVEVSLYKTADSTDSQKTILKLNEDKAVSAIIVQLPITDTAKTDEVVNVIEPGKDVDGLGRESKFDSATATAIMWLLAGYNIDVAGKNIVVIGRGRLVGDPLVKLLKTSGIKPTVLDENSPDFANTVNSADLIISAVGQPGLLKDDMVKRGAVVVDAGSASEDGQVKGDAAPELYDRQDLTITPKVGGVGPLTVAALFDNVLRSARAKVGP